MALATNLLDSIQLDNTLIGNFVQDQVDPESISKVSRFINIYRTSKLLTFQRFYELWKNPTKDLSTIASIIERKDEQGQFYYLRVENMTLEELAEFWIVVMGHIKLMEQLTGGIKKEFLELISLDKAFQKWTKGDYHEFEIWLNSEA